MRCKLNIYSIHTVSGVRPQLSCGDDDECLEGIDDGWQCRVGSGFEGETVFCLGMKGLHTVYGLGVEVFRRVRLRVIVVVVPVVVEELSDGFVGKEL